MANTKRYYNAARGGIIENKNGTHVGGAAREHPALCGRRKNAISGECKTGLLNR